MTGSLIAFWIIAVVSVGTALGVVLHRNPVRSALLLVVNFVCLAVIYLLLNAQVLAVLQVLVYAGAIMVLFLFVIMLLNLGGEMAQTDPLVGQRFVGLILGLALLTGLVYGINFYSANPAVKGPGAERATAAAAQGVSQVQVIGWDLFTRYVYPFELTSILLLVGVIGVVIFTRREGGLASPDAR
jgi:NADH-quinone oxidoreductase subunit J